MDLVSYPNLILLNSDQAFEVTVAHGKIWELTMPIISIYYAIYGDMDNLVANKLSSFMVREAVT